MLPPPPPTDPSAIVRISSLAAALAKLNVNIPIEDLLKAIHEEDEAALDKFIADANQHLGVKVDLSAEERRCRLLELAKEAFPDGKVPDPFTSTFPSALRSTKS